MVADVEKGASRLIDNVDHDTQNRILQLDQKLKDLLKDIQIQADARGENRMSLKKQQQLETLTEEVKTAIENINSIVNLVVPEDVSPAEFRKNNAAELQEIDQLFLENNLKIAEFEK